jgi:ferredoxin
MIKMKVIKSKCNGCKECKNICPVDAIIIRQGKARILQSKCIKCGACVYACKYGAIKNA